MQSHSRHESVEKDAVTATKDVAPSAAATEEVAEVAEVAPLAAVVPAAVLMVMTRQTSPPG